MPAGLWTKEIIFIWLENYTRTKPERISPVWQLRPVARGGLEPWTLGPSPWKIFWPMCFLYPSCFKGPFGAPPSRLCAPLSLVLWLRACGNSARLLYAERSVRFQKYKHDIKRVVESQRMQKVREKRVWQGLVYTYTRKKKQPPADLNYCLLLRWKRFHY